MAFCDGRLDDALEWGYSKYVRQDGRNTQNNGRDKRDTDTHATKPFTFH